MKFKFALLLFSALITSNARSSVIEIVSDEKFISAATTGAFALLDVLRIDTNTTTFRRLVENTDPNQLSDQENYLGQTNQYAINRTQGCLTNNLKTGIEEPYTRARCFEQLNIDLSCMEKLHSDINSIYKYKNYELPVKLLLAGPIVTGCDALTNKIFGTTLPKAIATRVYKSIVKKELTLRDPVEIAVLSIAFGILTPLIVHPIAGVILLPFAYLLDKAGLKINLNNSLQLRRWVSGGLIKMLVQRNKAA